MVTPKPSPTSPDRSSDLPPHVLTREQAEALVDTACTSLVGGGTISLMFGTIWQQTLTWGRNRVKIADVRRRQIMIVGRFVPGFGGSSALTNQFDTVSLKRAIVAAEDRAIRRSGSGIGRGFDTSFVIPPMELPTPEVPLWSDASMSVTAEDRAKLAAVVTEEVERSGMLSAGAVEIRVAAYASYNRNVGLRYQLYTQTESSVTVRHPKGIGSGWAGKSSFDWSTIDSTALARKAIEKCIASVDPVRIEPGRYTVILEPQATADVITPWMRGFGRVKAESEGKGPYAVRQDPVLNLWYTKLGMPIVDERITISHDPLEPGTAVLPQPGMAPIVWIERGVLKTLDVIPSYGIRGTHTLPKLYRNVPDYGRFSYRISGGDTTIEDMIASTKRGLWVTRFSNVIEIDSRSAMATGLTRDGLWLIEDGKVTKPVKNLRFLDSPLFMLNQVEQLGVPEPIYRLSLSGGGSLVKEYHEFMRGPSAAIVPALKIKDFNFAALVDAV